MVLEPILEPIFHEDSYGYRPGKSAHDAISITRERCWIYPWVVEFDIKGLFDNIEHKYIIKALEKHCDIKWIILYVKRWLKAPMKKYNGEQCERRKGTPQGGVVSPILANLFMHYAFDKWVTQRMPDVKFCRYADDGLLHCKSLKQAKFVYKMIENRFKECGVDIHPDKSRIVYCKHGRREGSYENIQFTFLGYTFKPRVAVNRKGERYLNFTPGVSREAMKSMKQKLRKFKLQLKNDWSIYEIAKFMNPILEGWFQYYGRFYKTAMRDLWRNVNEYLCKWTRRKLRKYSKHKVRSHYYLVNIAKTTPNMFVHWKLGYMPV